MIERVDQLLDTNAISRGRLSDALKQLLDSSPSASVEGSLMPDRAKIPDVIINKLPQALAVGFSECIERRTNMIFASENAHGTTRELVTMVGFQLRPRLDWLNRGVIALQIWAEADVELMPSMSVVEWDSVSKQLYFEPHTPWNASITLALANEKGVVRFEYHRRQAVVHLRI